MFRFEPVERCLYGRISSSIIRKSMRNEFLMVFGNKSSINYRVSVILTERNIQFFYYDDNRKVDLLHARNMDKLKEVGSISLTNPKEAGNDILEFPQNKRIIGKLKEIPFDIINEIIGQETTEGYRKLFYNFPFLCNEQGIKETQGEQTQKEQTQKEQVQKEQTSIQQSKLLCRFFRCCLLAFVFEYEDRNENFANSPLYDNVRDSLRKSVVYKLLAAKIQYTLYVPQDGISYNQEEYTYKAQKFADQLMDSNINKVIDPNYYKEEIWFYNPEEEIELLLEKNRQQCKQKGKKKQVATLKESLVSKIRSFLYTKHATYKAMTNKCSKNLFKVAQVLMTLFNIILFFSLLLCNKTLGQYVLTKPCFLWGGVIIAVSIVVIIIVAGCKNGHAANALFPRILVAELAAWLTIGIAEDLVKSMLLVKDVKFTLIAIGLVLSLIFLILFGEIKQHSPYVSPRQAFGRTFLILNHSVFFAFLLGVVMQLSFYNNLVKNSDVISTVIYNDYFDDAKYYQHNLEELNASLRQFEILYNTTEAIGSIKLDGGLRGTSQIKDTAGNLIGVVTSGARMSMKGKDNVDTGDYNKEVKMINASIREILLLNTSHKVEPFLSSKKPYPYPPSLEVVSCCNSIGDPYNYFCRSSLVRDAYCLDPLVNDTSKDGVIIASNRDRVNENMQKLREEIRNVRRGILSYNNYDTLMAWAEISNSNTQSLSNSTYLDSLTSNVKRDNRCWVKVSDKNEQRKFFPYLLIFHTLIVLVLAFVTQLIISDKSVTEPL